MILPAFGVTIATLQDLSARGCTLVDTTCGSVLNVWKNVKRYAQDGFTSVIHGKYWHEETQATASQALQYTNGHYLVVYDHGRPAVRATTFGTGATGPTSSRVSARRCRRDSIPTCTSSASALRTRPRCCHRSRWRSASGSAPQCGIATARQRATRYRSFDTICSATQERQDAVIALLEQEPLDVMLVIGGYNSSNTCNLARICDERLPTYHIAEPGCLLSRDAVRFRPVGAKDEIVADGWLPASGPVRLGLTAGASTPDNLVAEVIEVVDAFCNGDQR